MNVSEFNALSMDEKIDELLSNASHERSLIDAGKKDRDLYSYHDFYLVVIQDENRFYSIVARGSVPEKLERALWR